MKNTLKIVSFILWSTTALAVNTQMRDEVVMFQNSASEDRYFVNREWVTTSGTIFRLNRDGSGYRKFGKDETALVWRRNSSGLIEVVGKSTAHGTIKTWFFMFKDRRTGYYGDTADNLNLQISPK